MTLFFVLYDSIDHSIFEGQVLEPLVNRLKATHYHTVHIISFEHNITPHLLQLAHQYQTAHPTISISLLKRTRFITSFFLLKEALALKKLLAPFACYHLIARGPLAGWIAQKAITDACLNFTMQARGLLAEEFRYTYQRAPLWKQFFVKLRMWQLTQLEKEAFTQQHISIPFSIESVSEALSHYLQTTHNIPKNSFIPARFDTPQRILPEQKAAYNINTRKELSIPFGAIIYVFNGSLKPWQCPEESIASFKQAWLADNRSFFLALTHEVEAMHTLIARADLSAGSFKVLSVCQKKVMQYLCAAQYGFLLRDPHLINWVSRPTKLLEYRTAGISIIHNNTIAAARELDKQGDFKRK